VGRAQPQHLLELNSFFDPFFRDLDLWRSLFAQVFAHIANKMRLDFQHKGFLSVGTEEEVVEVGYLKSKCLAGMSD